MTTQGNPQGEKAAPLRCPSCHIEYPPETHECPKCGVVLAKWHSGKVLATPRLEGEQRSSPIVLYGGLAAAVLGAFYYFRVLPAEAPVETVQTQAPVPAGGTVVSDSGQSDAPMPDGWRFEGTVYDLRSGAPIAKAQVDIKAAAKVYRTITTAEGRYRRDVPALEAGGYGLSITHPDYRPVFLRGSPEALTEEFRGRMDCAKPGEPEVLTGKAGETTAADFMVCPRKN